MGVKWPVWVLCLGPVAHGLSPGFQMWPCLCRTCYFSILNPHVLFLEINCCHLFMRIVKSLKPNEIQEYEKIIRK